ncbi:MAG: sialidase family protein [Candidatus Limnocylindrales bacterium]
MTEGSRPTPFSENKQNEPWVAIDPSNPSVLAAGANDEIDIEACNAGDDTICPFTPGVGVSGISFSLDGGHTWQQPDYPGYSARTAPSCNPGVPDGPAGPTAADKCVPETPNQGGLIGTLPWYYEAGLSSGGDPALAFGPQPGPNGFSWANGSRLYYATLAANFPGRQAFKGFEAIAVSRTDNVAAAAAGNREAWMKPVIASKQSSTTFSDKEAIAADDAASSPYFGNVYVCNVAFRSAGAGSPEPIIFARSTDGGATWRSRQLSAATNTNQTGGRQGCMVKTDSRGVVYIVYIGTDIKTRGTVFFMQRSFDGGVNFGRSRIIARLTEVGLPDPATGRWSFDGVAGGRTNSFPSIDIANGAPSGFTAAQRAADSRRDEIVVAWPDGPTPSDEDPGPNEEALVRYSINGGNTFQNGGRASLPSERPNFPAIAISPDGQDVYMTYDSFLQPWQSTTALPRLQQGVVRHADVAASGDPGAWTDLERAPTGDARASSQNNLVAEFHGDYNYADATNNFGAAVWFDVRNAADCPAIDAFRQAFVEDVLSGAAKPLRETPRNRTDPNNHAAGLRPGPQNECPATWGNSDIWGGSCADPTP